MGNGLQVSLHNYSGSLHFPYRVQLGGFAAIELKAYPQGRCDIWTVQYTVDGSTCIVKLVLRPDEYGKVTTVTLFLEDRQNSLFGFFLHITQTGFIQLEPELILKWMKTSRTVSARGGITDTKVYLYGDGNMGGLLVLESKKNIRNDEEISEMSLVHYFAHRSGSAFMRTGSDIGLSIVAKVRAFNGNLDVTVEGLEQHPASALFYMFDEVNRSGVWKFTMCPHCADKRRGRMFRQSDSEESDGNVVVPWQRNGEAISNEGRFKGNGNGNFIRCKYYYSSK